MHIKVISLKGSALRRSNITRQLVDQSVDFSFFDAVTPQLAAQEIDGYDPYEFFANCGRLATDSEIACYASHLALWRDCAADDRPWLILEDDAALSPNFVSGLDVVERHVADMGFIRVSIPAVRSAATVAQENSFDIRRCRRVPLLALGYALSPAAARALVATGAVVEEPVDKFIQRFWRHGQRVYALHPPIVGCSEHASLSDIGPRHRNQYTPSSWIRRAMRKSSNSIARTLANLPTSKSFPSFDA